MAKSPKALVQEKIRKLQALAKLLDDPDISSLIAQFGLPGEKFAGTSPAQMKLPVTRKPGRKPGALVKEALTVVQSGTTEVSAKRVTEIMERRGFVFETNDKEIAVSKALRKLAKEGIIEKRRSGLGKKSALLYKPIGPSLVPVQEKAL